MQLSRVLSKIPSIQWRSPVVDVEIEDIVIDSRAVEPGSLFVALKGAAVDGHDYIDAAIARGASALLVDQSCERDRWPSSIAVLCVQDTRAVLGDVAAEFFEHPSKSMHVIGITGTNGKTTTSYVLEQALKAAGRSPGVIGTVNYRWNQIVRPAPNTTPESIALHRLMATMLADGVDTVILEVSSHGLETHRVVGVHFNLAMFTNLTQDHLDFHGSMEAYYKAKASFFTQVLRRSCKSNRAIVINQDDPYSERLLEDIDIAWAQDVDTPARHLTSMVPETDAPWKVVSHHDALSGASLLIEAPDAQTVSLITPMLGAFNASNTLQALVACAHMGIALDDVRGAFESWGGVPGRLQRVGSHSPAVFVDYAHTPDALERALETLRPMTPDRLWVVFGAGGDRDRAKRPIMGQIAARCADVVVVTSDNPRTEAPDSIIHQIIEGVGAHHPHLERDRDRANAIANTIAQASTRDVVLIAGKGHETYQEINNTRYDFDDVEHAQRALTVKHQRLLERCSPEQLLAFAHGETWLHLPDGPLQITRLITDSRQAQPGDLFVALVGERFDAHRFLRQVAESGASAAIVSAPQPDIGIPQLVVSDTLASLQSLGRAIWDLASLRHQVSLTGSNGKTTTKEILRVLWSSIGNTHATGGNYNNHIGVPLTLVDLRASHDVAIIEMGANAPGDIGELTVLAPSDIRIITSIGHAHIEGFGGLDGVRRTKAELFNDANASTWAIVPDTERGLVDEDFPGKVLTFGSTPQADVRIVSADVVDGGGATRVVLAHAAQTHTLKIPLVGAHNASNLAAAFASLIATGQRLSEDVLNDALTTLHVPGGRWRQVEAGPYLFIDDAYNANPSSVAASFDGFLQWRRAQSDDKPNVMVLGEMLELGSDAKNWHNRVIRDISVEEDLTMILCVGTFAPSMAQEARRFGHDDLTVVDCEDVDHAARVILEMNSAVIFLKASRGARLERVIQNVQDGLA